MSIWKHVEHVANVAVTLVIYSVLDEFNVGHVVCLLCRPIASTGHQQSWPGRQPMMSPNSLVS